MDPISAAGIGLSVVSLAFQVFSGCKKDMVGMPAEYQHLRTKLRIEQSRMLIWGEKIGLVEELLDSPSRSLSMNRNLIIDVLLEIQTCFRSVVQVTDNYDRVVSQKDVPAQSRSDLPSPVSLLRRSLRRSRDGVARLQWTIVKQDKFENLVEKLTRYNNSMESFLDQSMLDSLRVQQEQATLLLVQVTDQIGQLQDLVDALRLTPARIGLAKADDNMSRGMTLAGSDSSSISTFNLAKFKLQQKNIKPLPDNAQDLLLDFASLFPLDRPPEQRRSYTRLYDRDVWVEWTEPVPSLPSVPNLAQMMESRIVSLAATLSSPMKPSVFRSPRCLGYLKDEGYEEGLRFGLVYDASLPSGSRNQTETRSLRDVLRTEPKPSLNLRISLACKIAESLMYLHTVNWLHKGIESDSILFLIAQSCSWRPSDLEDPIISGFEFSRPDLAGEITVKQATPVTRQIYRHPELLSSPTTRAQKSHDIYSMGLVLLEIAYWKPIEEIVEVPMRSSAAMTVRDKLLRESFREYGDLREALGAEMGDDYAEASYRCIKGGELLGIPENSNEADTVIGGEILQTYSQEVLSRLRLSRL